MTEISPSPTLTTDAARALTDKVKTDAARIWTTLLRLYEGGAHTALGYASWHEYCAAEFDMSKSRAYRLLNAGRVHEIVQSPSGRLAPSERAARELTPVLRKDPERVGKLWGEVVELHGPEPTAEQVRQVVRSTPPPERMPRRLTAAYLDSDRKRTDAENAKQRLFDFVQLRAAVVDDVASVLKIEKAMPVLTDQEIRGLVGTIDDGIAQTQRLRRSLQKHLDLRHKAS